jgi:hypothetical protein
VWVAQGELTEAAALLAGFPVSLEDKREVSFGAIGPKFAGGAMTLQFACIDRAGHCQLHVTMEADFERRDLVAERVGMLSVFEPAALDQIVGQMRELNSCSLDRPCSRFHNPFADVVTGNTEVGPKRRNVRIADRPDRTPSSQHLGGYGGLSRYLPCNSQSVNAASSDCSN